MLRHESEARRMPHQGLNSTTFFWLILITFIVALLARGLKIPYTLTLVVTGLGLGLTRLMPQLHLEPSLLLTVFLPPLLFETAINLPLDALRRDWKPIALYALAGTALSTFIVAGATSRLLGIPLPYALVFGALISTTDPIAVIAVFKKLNAGKRLTLLIEAESLFNDGIAVTLFMVTLALATGGKVSAATGAVQFLTLVGGGALLGGVLGAAASRIHYELDDHLIEITLTSVVAFGAYLSAESLHVSGVIAVVTAGIVLRNYGMESGMSQNTRLAVSAFWEYAAFLVNSFVFLLIGIEVVHVNWRDKILAATVAILVGIVGQNRGLSSLMSYESLPGGHSRFLATHTLLGRFARRAFDGSGSDSESEIPLSRHARRDDVWRGGLLASLSGSQYRSAAESVGALRQ